MSSVMIKGAAVNHCRIDWLHPSFLSPTKLSGDLPFLSTVYVKLGYQMLMAFIFIKRFFESGIQLRNVNYSPPRIFFGSKTTRVRQIFSCLIIALMTFNFLLIAIVNPSLLNPGPQNLSVYYQNVQGLIPFSNLSDTHPKLNRTKVLELNTYIHTERPAVVLLTETWLTKSINDNEVIDNYNYNVYRNDRSLLSHPVDRTNPKKFRKMAEVC